MASISEVLDKIIKQYQPGGDFGKAELALLKRAKTKAMAGVGQQLVSAGLAGTTAGAGAAQRWEEETGMPARLKLEDVRTERLVQALLAKAGFMQEQQKMSFEAQQARLQRQFQAQQAVEARPSMAERGLDVFGQPFEQSLLGPRQPQQPAGAGVSTHTGKAGGVDFTVPGGVTGGPEKYVSDPTMGQPVIGTDIVAGAGAGYVGDYPSDYGQRAPITTAAPTGEPTTTWAETKKYSVPGYGSMDETEYRAWLKTRVSSEQFAQMRW